MCSPATHLHSLLSFMHSLASWMVNPLTSDNLSLHPSSPSSTSPPRYLHIFHFSLNLPLSLHTYSSNMTSPLHTLYFLPYFPISKLQYHKCCWCYYFIIHAPFTFDWNKHFYSSLRPWAHLLCLLLPYPAIQFRIHSPPPDTDVFPFL